MSHSDTENVYYDVLIQQPLATSPVPAEFDATSKFPILTKASDWNMSVVRFSIPTNLIPLFNFQIQGGIAQADRDLGVYSVTLVRGATTVQTYLRYTNWNNYVTPLPKPPSQLPPLYVQDQMSPYYGVFSVRHMIEMINTALETAHAGLPVIVGSEAPYFIYDNVTGIISLIAQKANYDVNVPGYTEIYVNSALFRFMQSIPVRRFGYNIPLGKDFQIMVADRKNNSYDATHYSVGQTYASLSDWNDLTSIIFRSGSIPSRAEYTPNGGGITANASDAPSQSILNDFIQYPVENGNLRGMLLYNPTAEYRWINLIGDGELRTMKLSVYWSDRYQNMHQIYINPYEQLSAKMLFQKKKYT